MKKQIEIHKIDISSLLKSYNAELMDAYVIDNDFIKKVPTDKTTSLQKANSIMPLIIITNIFIL